jgi:hypothetical protein
MKLTTHLKVVPRSSICESLHPLLHTSSWHIAELIILLLPGEFIKLETESIL